MGTSIVLTDGGCCCGSGSGGGCCPDAPNNLVATLFDLGGCPCLDGVAINLARVGMTTEWVGTAVVADCDGSPCYLDLDISCPYPGFPGFAMRLGMGRFAPGTCPVTFCGVSSLTNAMVTCSPFSILATVENVAHGTDPYNRSCCTNSPYSQVSVTVTE